MSGLTRFFLVLMRLVIGWHLLFAGIEKFRKDGWTSEGYLRESYGPLAPTFRRVAGDAVLDRVTLLPLSDDSELGKALPPALAAEWDAYFEQFARHYKLSEEQRSEAKEKLDKQKKRDGFRITSLPRPARPTCPNRCRRFNAISIWHARKPTACAAS